jgi:chromosome segregation ATPase
LEAQLDEHVKGQNELQQEVARVKRLSETLAERNDTHEKFSRDLEEAQSELNRRQERIKEEQGKLENRTNELQGQHDSAIARVKELTDALSEETRRRESVEQRAGSASERSVQLEGELAKQTGEVTRLRQELEDTRRSIEAEQQRYGTEVKRLLSRTQELEAAQIETKAQIDALNTTLAAEAKRRECAENQVATGSARSMKLEAELASQSRRAAQLRLDLEEARHQLDIQQQGHSAKVRHLTVRTQELIAAQTETQSQIEDLTARLSVETKRRESAERESAHNAERHVALEAELEAKQGAYNQSRLELESVQARLVQQEEVYRTEKERLAASTQSIQNLTAELEQVRASAELETAQRRKLAAQLADAEASLSNWRSQAESAQEQLARQAQSIETLKAQSKSGRDEISKLESLLQDEVAQKRHVRQQAEALQRRVSELTAELSSKTAAEQDLRQREAQLESALAIQKDHFNYASNRTVILESKLTVAQRRVEELELIQTALCARVKELTAQHETIAQQVKALQTRLQDNVSTLHDRDHQLACLRFAVLAASQNHSLFHSERLTAEDKIVAGVRHMMASLMHTPLSPAQRNLLDEMIGVLDGWHMSRTNVSYTGLFPIEPPVRQIGKFNLAAALDAAFDCAKSQAAKAGASCDCIRSGDAPDVLHGDASQIQQLITRFASSLREFAEAASIRISATVGNAASDVIPVKLIWSTANAENDPTLQARVRAVAAASANLQAAQMGTAEAGLAAAWQLALVMEGAPEIVSEVSGPWHFEVTLPLAIASSDDKVGAERCDSLIGTRNLPVSSERNKNVESDQPRT